MEDSPKWLSHLNITEEEFNAWVSEKPENTPSSFWCLIQNKVNSSDYLQWAKNFYKIPQMSSDYKNFKQDLSFWDNIKNHSEWCEFMIPIYYWESTLFVLVTEPIKYKGLIPIQFVLGSIEQMEYFWAQLNPTSNEQNDVDLPALPVLKTEVNSSAVNLTPDEESQDYEKTNFVSIDNLESQSSKSESLQHASTELPEEDLNKTNLINLSALDTIPTPEPEPEPVKEIAIEQPEEDLDKTNLINLSALDTIPTPEPEPVKEIAIEQPEEDLDKTNLINLSSLDAPIEVQNSVSTGSIGNEEANNKFNIDSTSNFEEEPTHIEFTENEVSMNELPIMPEQKTTVNQTPANFEAQVVDATALLSLDSISTESKTSDTPDGLNLNAQPDGLNLTDELSQLTNTSHTNSTSGMDMDSLIQTMTSAHDSKSRDEQSGVDQLDLASPDSMPELSVTSDEFKLNQKTQFSDESEPTIEGLVQHNSSSNAENSNQLTSFSKINKDFQKSLSLEVKDNQIFVTHQDGQWDIDSELKLNLERDPCLFKFCLISKLPFHGFISDKDSIKIQLFKKLNITNNTQHVTLLPLIDQSQNVSRFILTLGNKDNLPALERLQEHSSYIYHEIIQTG